MWRVLEAFEEFLRILRASRDMRRRVGRETNFPLIQSRVFIGGKLDTSKCLSHLTTI